MAGHGQGPDEIYKIPPSNPHYNTTNVYVFDSTPDVVYTGYYPGYVNSYIYGGCVVYGTGWYYPPYVSPRVYYPFVPTWGFGVGWNPWTGWSFGISWGYGPFRITSASAVTGAFTGISRLVRRPGVPPSLLRPLSGRPGVPPGHHPPGGYPGGPALNPIAGGGAGPQGRRRPGGAAQHQPLRQAE